eukprot:CFRG2253T1
MAKKKSSSKTATIEAEKKLDSRRRTVSETENTPYKAPTSVKRNNAISSDDDSDVEVVESTKHPDTLTTALTPKSADSQIPVVGHTSSSSTKKSRKKKKVKLQEKKMEPLVPSVPPMESEPNHHSHSQSKPKEKRKKHLKKSKTPLTQPTAKKAPEIICCPCSKSSVPITCKYTSVGCKFKSTNEAAVSMHEVMNSEVHLMLAMDTIEQMKLHEQDRATRRPKQGHQALTTSVYGQLLERIERLEAINNPTIPYPSYAHTNGDSSSDDSDVDDECDACHEEGELFKCGHCKKRYHEVCDPLREGQQVSMLMRRKKRRCGDCEWANPSSRKPADKDASDNETVHNLMEESAEESTGDESDSDVGGFIVESSDDSSDED